MNASPYLLGLEKSCYNDDFAPKLLRHSLARRNMGGLGSTRWIGESTKDTVDDTRSLDINRLNHAGCLHPGYRGGWEWKRDGARVAWINLFRDDHRLILSYRYRKDGGEWRDVDQPTPVVWMPCRFGGRRPYFLCPGKVNGIHCYRRVTKLYGAGVYFLCRHCYQLAYACQRKIATSAPRAARITSACGSAETRGRRCRSLSVQRVCTIGLTSASALK